MHLRTLNPEEAYITGNGWGLNGSTSFFASPYAYRTIRNTVLLSLYSILFGFPTPILFAVCVTEIVSDKVKRIVQTVSYLPHFISTVVLVGMIIATSFHSITAS